MEKRPHRTTRPPWALPLKQTSLWLWPWILQIQRTLMQPEVKQAGKEQVKKKAKESIMDILAKAKINADRDNRERWEREGRIAPTKKNDIEL